MSIVLVILSTFGTIHIRHVNFIARWGVLKTGVDCKSIFSGLKNMLPSLLFIILKSLQKVSTQN